MDEKQSEKTTKKPKNYFEAREDSKLSLRKKKLDIRLRQKRNLLISSANEEGKDLEIDPSKLTLPQRLLDIKSNPNFNIISAIKSISQSSPIDEVKFIIFLVRTYSQSNKESIEDLLKANIADLINSLLQKYQNDNSIIYECLWILINISFNLNTPDLSNFLLSDNWFKIWEAILKKDIAPLTLNLVWLFHNIVFNAPQSIHLLFDKPFFSYQFLPLLTRDNNSKATMEFGFNIITIGAEQIREPQYSNIQEAITKLMCDYHRNAELTQSCIICLSSLSYINHQSIISLIYTSGIMRRIIRRELDINNVPLDKVFILIGNLINYLDESMIDITVTQELVAYIKDHLTIAMDSKTRKDICWCLANVCCGSSQQVKSVISAGLLPLLEMVVKKDHFTVVYEALYCLSSIATSEEIECCIQLDSIHIIDLLIETIKNYENYPDILMLCLEAFDGIFNTGRRISEVTNGNVFLNLFEKKGGKDILQKLSTHQNQKVYNMTLNVAHKYFQTA